MAIFLIVVLVLALCVVLARYLLLKRQLRRWSADIAEISADRTTNRRLRMETADRDAIRLASAVNGLYEDVYAQRAAHAGELRRVQRGMADISHDLRTPLTSINGYLGLMAKPETTPAQRAEYLKTAREKGANMAKLVEQLFMHTRLEAGDYPLEMRPVELNDVIRTALAAAYGMLREAGIQPDVRLTAGPLPIVADPAGLERVFGNLFSNCARHGGGNMVVKTRLADGAVYTYIANYAPNLAPEDVDVEQLFERSYVPDKARTGTQSGLGLAIVRQFVTAMGGEVSAALEDGILTITLAWPEYK